MPPSTKATPLQQAAWEASTLLAERDLAHIEALLDNPAFDAYFRRRLRERRAAHAKALEAHQPEIDSAKLRARLEELDEILAMPERDRANHTTTLARHSPLDKTTNR